MWKNIFGTKSTNDAVLAFKKGEDALGQISVIHQCLTDKNYIL